MAGEPSTPQEMHRQGFALRFVHGTEARLLSVCQGQNAFQGHHAELILAERCKLLPEIMLCTTLLIDPTIEIVVFFMPIGSGKALHLRSSLCHICCIAWLLYHYYCELFLCFSATCTASRPTAAALLFPLAPSCLASTTPTALLLILRSLCGHHLCTRRRRRIANANSENDSTQNAPLPQANSQRRTHCEDEFPAENEFRRRILTTFFWRNSRRLNFKRAGSRCPPGAALVHVAGPACRVSSGGNAASGRNLSSANASSECVVMGRSGLDNVSSQCVFSISENGNAQNADALIIHITLISITILISSSSSLSSSSPPPASA